ncbi:hypothetical protein [Methylorubrum extorquens]|uniref:hypothetical protein n=1 Tax=Methylorubrum extorquens TaxID=408 RepID=UPI001EE61C15|nr:hypothetical protein [Methylorubrum extorquens]MCG5247950.1 hypothetical protein [Methylorubrum extorquens]
MIAAAKPIHTANVAGKPFRFFRGPGDAPDMPWHAHDDLLAALALPRPLRRELRAKMLKNFGPECRTVEVGGEPVLIAPHYVAQGLISAAQEGGKGITEMPAQVDRDYVTGGMAAMKTLTAGLGQVEGFEYAMQAFRNQGGDP